jgi:hypothetical protein
LARLVVVGTHLVFIEDLAAEPADPEERIHDVSVAIYIKIGSS